MSVPIVQIIWQPIIITAGIAALCGIVTGLAMLRIGKRRDQ